MYEYKALVTKIVDGDTFDAEVDLGFSIYVKTRFRVKDLDTPETYRPRNEAEKSHGKLATERAKQLLLLKTVTLKTEKGIGIYGRYIATVILNDGSDYKDIMIQEGFQKLDKYEDISE